MLAQIPPPFAGPAARHVEERLAVAAGSLALSECEDVLRFAEEPQCALPQGLSAEAGSLVRALRALALEAGPAARAAAADSAVTPTGVLCSRALAACRTVLLTRQLDDACSTVRLFLDAA